MTTTGRSEPLAHTEATFSLTLEAPMEVVTPLFGAERERVWADDWDPEFVYPTPAADREGMVFTVAHDGARSIWVNTRFDLDGGHVQYCYVLPSVMATRITIRVSSEGRSTRVDVTYERTALRAEVNEHVRRLSDADRGYGSEWQEQIGGYLRRRAARS